MSLVTGIFFLVLLLNQRWSPPLRLQASHCSTFRIVCDVPSTAVFCSESIECFPHTASKFLCETLVTIPVASIITGVIIHLTFHIRYNSKQQIMYFSFFPDYSCMSFIPYLLVLPLLSGCMFFLSLFSVTISALFIIISFVLLLLLLLSSSSSSSPLCRVFILIFLRQTMSLGNTVLQLFCCYYSWYLYH